MKSLFTEENRKKYLFILGLCVAFGLAAHGYRLMINLYTHDTLMDLVEDNIQYQRAIGRFMQTFTMLFRGTVCTPWIIGLAGLVFFSFSAFLITDILKITGKFSIALVCGIMVCNITITTSAAAFIPWFDVYGAALFFAVLGVWLILQDKLWDYIAGGVSIVISLGFYQAYLNVALVLILVAFLKAFRNEKTLSFVWTRIGKTAATFAGAAGCYYAVFKMVCIIHHVSKVENYNSIDTLNSYEGVSLGNLIAITYRNFIGYFTKPSGFVAKIGSFNNIWSVACTVASVLVLALIFSGVVLLLIKKKPHWSVWVINIVGIMAVPIFANFVCIISKGVDHVLTIYSFVLMFVWAIALWEEYCELVDFKWVTVCKTAATLLTLVCVWNNIVFSNQLYFRLDLQDRAFESYASRLVNDIENTPGYEYIYTQVVLYGSFENSDYFFKMPQISNVGTIGVGKTPITYMSTVYNYVSYYLNTFMNIMVDENPTEKVRNMPCYPAKGSIVFDGDLLLVKISD